MGESAIGTQLDGAGKRAGSRMSGFIGGTLKKGVIGVGLAAGGLLGTSLAKGFSRLNAIDQARAKLAGLGHDAKSVDLIMTNALASVRGTAFGLDEAASVAAGTVAAGIKPGRRLTKTLKLIADASTIAGTSLGDMGAVFNKVAASNKIQGDVIAQLNDAGIPIIQLLGKQLHTTAAETTALASKGAINFATFQKAMEAGLGGAALKSGNTVQGAFKNLLASLGRIGANVLSGGFSRLPALLGSITKLLGPVEEFAGRFGTKLGDIANIGWDKLAAGVTAVRDFFTAGAGAPILAAAIEGMSNAGDRLKSGLSGAASALGRIKTNASKIDFSKIDTKALGQKIAQSLISGLKYLSKFSGKLLDFFKKVDWVGLGIKVGGYALPFVLGLSTGIINAVASPEFLKGVWDHLPEILGAALVVAFAPERLVGKIGEALARIPFVGRFLAAALKWVNSLGGPLRKFAGDLFETFGRAFKGEIPGGGLISAVLRALRRASSAVGAFFADLGTRIGVWALDAFSFMGRSAGRAVGGFMRFVGRIPGRIIGALGSLGRLLYNAGRELISGLIRGITSKLGDLTGAMGKIASKIKGFLPGSPVREGPLTSWNNGGAGKRLGDLLAQGLNDTRSVDLAMTNLSGRIAVPALSLGENIPASSRPGTLAAGTSSRVAMTITNWADGTGHFETIADSRVDAANADAGMQERAFG